MSRPSKEADPERETFIEMVEEKLRPFNLSKHELTFLTNRLMGMGLIGMNSGNMQQALEGMLFYVGKDCYLKTRNFNLGPVRAKIIISAFHLKLPPPVNRVFYSK